MTDNEILVELKDIFKSVFNREIELTFETSAKDVKGWDSLMHIALIGAVEDRFKMKFKMKEVLSMQNIHDMIVIIQKGIK